MFTACSNICHDKAYTYLTIPTQIILENEVYIYGDRRKENAPIVFEFYKHYKPAQAPVCQVNCELMLKLFPLHYFLFVYLFRNQNTSSHIVHTAPSYNKCNATRAFALFYTIL